MKIQNLFIYPVKSLQGIELYESTLLKTGLAFDRQWMIVDEKGGFITQRQNSKLAEMQVFMTEHELTITKRHTNESLSVPIDCNELSSTDVEVWGSSLKGKDYGIKAQEFLTDLLGSFKGSSLRLVRYDQGGGKRSLEKHQSQGAHTYFADEYPYLVVSQESLDDLNRRLRENGSTEEFTMNRFRPNIVTIGSSAYAEDKYDSLVIGEQKIKIDLVKPCQRCVITTINPIDLSKNKEPLYTLSLYKKKKDGKGVLFGHNGILTTKEGGKVKKGDSIKFV